MSALYFAGAQVKREPLEWQKMGLNYTASGYGSKIPTQYTIFHDEKWRRVYCCIYSNIGSLYVMQGREKIIVNVTE